jgi:hypothetical protein
MSYGRMKKKQTELEQEIEELLARAESEDQDEDARFGAGKRGDEAVIAEVRDRSTRKKWIREQLAALEKETRLGRAAELDRQASSSGAMAPICRATTARP